MSHVIQWLKIASSEIEIVVLLMGNSMSLDKNGSEYVERIAEEVLAKFQQISTTAEQQLKEEIDDSAATLAQPQTWTSGDAARKLRAIGAEVSKSTGKLSHEPAIARVVALNDKGEQEAFYVCRATPISGIKGLASYRSPVGRLASIPVGDEMTIPGAGSFEVLEQAQLHPQFADDAWDSRNSVVESALAGPITIRSFREFLEETPGATEPGSILDELLADESQKTNILDGLRRKVLTKMGLRDQPILDKFQDEIFRLPLNSKLLLLGPAGTGKTTTLIRRLGQKLDYKFLDESERAVLKKSIQDSGVERSASWLMFTPTELLKHYLKEAFAREGIPAPDQCINTWRYYQQYIARNVLSILKTSTGAGSFVLRDDLNWLDAETVTDSIGWYEDFDSWQRKKCLDDLVRAASDLEETGNAAAEKVGARLTKILDGASRGLTVSIFRALVNEIGRVTELRSALKQSTDEMIKKWLNLQLANNREFLDELAEILGGMKISDEDDEDEEDEENEEDEAEISGYGKRTLAHKAYNRAIRSYARSLARKRKIRPESTTGKLLEWLGERLPPEEDLQSVGNILVIQSHALRFVNPVRGFLNGVPRRYRVFRRLRNKEGLWYKSDKLIARELDPLELDLILLAMLSSARSFFADKQISKRIKEKGWSSLEYYVGLYRGQVLVDEAADFSPVQLACMAAISDPGIESFFACGDFNQRLTRWGSQSAESLQWACPGLQIRKISVTYRQTRQLNELAHAIIAAMGGADDMAELPESMDNEGVNAALVEQVKDVDAVVSWLAARIHEIERFVDSLPSIAIFVNDEASISPLAESLSIEMAEANIKVVACPNGQVIGQENEVRVFDVQHIKGLEFEAAFFIGIDALAEQKPELFDKYLYVGATRAATYLGVTCENQMPSQISKLRSYFVDSWGIA